MFSGLAVRHYSTSPRALVVRVICLVMRQNWERASLLSLLNLPIDRYLRSQNCCFKGNASILADILLCMPQLSPGLATGQLCFLLLPLPVTPDTASAAQLCEAQAGDQRASRQMMSYTAQPADA